MGEWVKLYVGDEATPDQVEAAEHLFAAALPSFAGWGIVSTERVPVSIERTDTSFSFSSPESTVVMDLMLGRDGEAIRVENLSVSDYVQYKSRVNRHRGGGQEFDHTGTSGFTASLETGG